MNSNKKNIVDVAAAKVAAGRMLEEWSWWKVAIKEDLKREHLAKYAAAYTICRVFLETFLKARYPAGVPMNVLKDVLAIMSDMEKIEKVSESSMEKLLRDIDQLERDAA